MNKIIKRIIIVFAPMLFISVSGLRADTGRVKVKDILDRMDKLYRYDSSSGKLRMSIQTPNWKRTLEMKVWAKGKTKTFIRILSPAREKGVSTLRIDREMWNYFPRVDKVMKIPPSMMMASWMGSDFTNDDLVKESSLVDDYDAEMIGCGTSAAKDCYCIKLTPKADTATVWGKIVIVIRKTDYLPVTETYYDEKGKQIRTIHFKKIRVFDDKKIPAVLELNSQVKPGNKTIIEYLELNFKKVGDSVFTLKNLRKKV